MYMRDENGNIIPVHLENYKKRDISDVPYSKQAMPVWLIVCIVILVICLLYLVLKYIMKMNAKKRVQIENFGFY